MNLFAFLATQQPWASFSRFVAWRNMIHCANVISIHRSTVVAKLSLRLIQEWDFDLLLNIMAAAVVINVQLLALQIISWAWSAGTTRTTHVQVCVSTNLTWNNSINGLFQISFQFQISSQFQISFQFSALKCIEFDGNVWVWIHDGPINWIY